MAFIGVLAFVFGALALLALMAGILHGIFMGIWCLKGK